MKTKKCKVCKEQFHPERQLQQVCSALCASEYGRRHLAKKKLEVKKIARKELKQFNDSDVKGRTKVAKQVVQEYARLRDINEPCISCRKPTAKQWDGGHFMNAEFYSKVRFNTWNIHKQCSHCNDFSASNALEYEKHLIIKIGKEKVEWLKQQKGVQKYTAEYLNKLIRIFRKKIRKMKKILM